MLILGIETSCDETSVALVRNGSELIANDVASQVRMHAAFGGVVPELASRAHIQKLVPMVDACLTRNHMNLGDVDAFSVTLGPGLIGALLVGVETAKALAFSVRKPLIPVHHVGGHLYSPFIRGSADRHRLLILEGGSAGEDASAKTNTDTASAVEGDGAANVRFPYVGLVVSGGHSSLVLVRSPLEYEVLGETVDDAAGEAFDKLAKLLSLGYPGGPQVQRFAEGGDRLRYPLPRPMLGRGNTSLDFSFSGLKTAVQKLVKDLGGPGVVLHDRQILSDLCASFQESVVEVLLRKSAAAMHATGVTQLAVVGGVACNSRLRAAVKEYLPPQFEAIFPPPSLCTDNAAMIAGLAYHQRDIFQGANLALNAVANLDLNFAAKSSASERQL